MAVACDLSGIGKDNAGSLQGSNKLPYRNIDRELGKHSLNRRDLNILCRAITEWIKVY